VKKPKVVLVSASLSRTECELAELCGIFAVLQAPCQLKSIEWTITFARKSTRRLSRAVPEEKTPKFDVFIGAPDGESSWVCAVDGLVSAREEMERLAKQRPGRYFLFHAPSRTVVTEIETFATSRARRESA
jgi:hypothetical protein